MRIATKYFISTLFALSIVLSYSCKDAKKKLSIDDVSISVLDKDEMRALRSYFNDKHLEEAHQSKIKNAIKDKKTFYENEKSFCKKNNLIKIENNQLYSVARLTHSLPFVNKKTNDFLELLGERMEESFKEKGLQYYRFVITSVLRTEDDQRKLLRVNVNATPNETSHYYGTTFDISQTRFISKETGETLYNYRLRNILARELIRLQEEKKCYVLIENQEKCFHITAIQ